MDKKRTALAGILVLLLAFLAFGALTERLLTGWQVDLTEEKLYTLSPAAREILAELDEPIRLDLYFTEDAADAVPTYRNYARRVEEFLETIAAAGDGKVEVRVVDPEPYSEAEDAARAAGLSPVVVDEAGTTLMLGLVGTNSVDEQEVLPFLDPSNEPFLEYDVMRMIQALAQVDPPKVALVTSLPMNGSAANPFGGGRPSPPWQVLQQMRQLYDVVDVSPTAANLPDGVDVVVLAHPKGLSEGLLRAIDDYALAGGDLLVLVDPFCEADPAAAGGRDPFGQSAPGPAHSELDGLLEAWGVEFHTDRFVADRGVGLRVARGPGADGLQSIVHVGYLGVPAELMDRDDPITGSLEQVNLGIAGWFESAEGAESRLVPLIRSSHESTTMPVSRVSRFPDLEGLLSSFAPDADDYVLAARLEGTIRSAFPPASDDTTAAEVETVAEEAEEGGPAADGAVEEDGAADEAGADSEEAEAGEADAVRTGEAGGIVLIADADLLRDDFWIVEQRFGPVSLGWQPIADNGALVLNSLDVLAGSPALLELRSRGSHHRPFTKVEALREEAEARFLSEQQRLEDEIAAAEDRIRQLQAEGAGAGMILTPEVAQELDRLQEQVLEARKELRAVRYGLRKDIDRLGRRVMLIDVVGVPLLVAFLVLALTWAGRRRRT